MLIHSQITGLKTPPVTSNAADALNALKTHPSATPYRPPGPRPNSGIHRYSQCVFRLGATHTAHAATILAAFLLFQEPAASEPFTIPQGAPEYGAALEERRSWDPVAFAEKHGLKLVGANYFLVRSAEVDTTQ